MLGYLHTAPFNLHHTLKINIKSVSVETVSSKFLKTLTFIILTNILLSCTSVPKTTNLDFQLENRDFLYNISNWSFSGKIGYSDAKQSFSASINWTHQALNDEIELAGPFGQGRTQISLSPKSVTFDTGNNRHEYIGNIDEHVFRQLGLSLPISALKYWVLGLVDPETEYFPLTNGFSQSGWVINYSQMQQIELNQMPRKLIIKKGDTQFKLIIKHWNL